MATSYAKNENALNPRTRIPSHVARTKSTYRKRSSGPGQQFVGLLRRSPIWVDHLVHGSQPDLFRRQRVLWLRRHLPQARLAVIRRGRAIVAQVDGLEPIDGLLETLA